MEQNKPNFLKIPIKYLLQFEQDFLKAEVFIKLGEEKYIRLTLKEESFFDTILNYQKKGLEDVYLNEQDYLEILGQIKNRLSGNQFFNPDTVTKPEDIMESLENTFNVAKEFMTSIGANSDVAEICKRINTQAIKMVSKKGNIFTFFKDFKKNCTEQFLKSIITSHLLVIMIDKFSWRSGVIKEKASMASLLCDMTLKPEDFKWIDNPKIKPQEVPEEIKRHTTDITAILRKSNDIIHLETITIIEQHHETPDGFGYPHGLQPNRINQLSAIFIVARDFVSRLILCDFDYTQKDAILAELKILYCAGTFEKAFEALYLELGKT